MDLIKLIEELRREEEKVEGVIASLEVLQAAGIVQGLRREKENLESVIASLEELHAAKVASPQKKRPGRRSMSREERREVSERMKRYWADWHNKRRRT